jgi:hypothetical protein
MKNITEIRRDNMNNNRLKGAFVNKQKGLLKFVKSQSKKGDIIHNEIIDELIDNKYYNIIYEKFMESEDVDIENIPEKDFDLLQYLEFCHPDELSKKYKGFTIQKLNF